MFAEGDYVFCNYVARMGDRPRKVYGYVHQLDKVERVAYVKVTKSPDDVDLVGCTLSINTHTLDKWVEEKTYDEDTLLNYIDIALDERNESDFNSWTEKLRALRSKAKV